jgi:hypothetical protein
MKQILLETLNSRVDRVRSNQSLKLTEPAVDDFAARCGTIRKDAAGRARVVYVNQPVRCRQLSSGPLASGTNSYEYLQ